MRILVIAVLCAGACGDDGSRPGDGGVDAPGTVDPRPLVAVVPATPNRDLDLLFVIDDSSSMADKQMNLANNFPNFVNVLNAVPGGLPNLHLGVVTTDMGTKGTDSPTPGAPVGALGQGGCSGTGKSGNLLTNGASVTGTFVSDIKQSDGTRVKNYTGNLTDVFSQMARLGSGGCGFEQPLAAMKAALDTNPMNVGFLRPSALLGVVFVTDEDDCSFRTPTLLAPQDPALGRLDSFRCTRFGVTCSTGGTTSDAMNTVGPKSGCAGAPGSQFMSEVAPYASFLKTLKGDTRLVVTASIMGTPEPFSVELRAPQGTTMAVPALAHSCMYQGAQGLEVADPPVRMREFFDQFPNASVTDTICQADLSGDLALIGQLLQRGIGQPCISVDLADADPTMPGKQFDCVVEDVVGTTVTKIPACGSAPCWRLEPDAATCTAADHLKLVIDRTTAPDPATVTQMRCAVP